MQIDFYKYSGSGNDFILIDDRKEVFPSSNKEVITKLCHRNFGIGADGVILLQKSATADCLMRIFNSDGSEAEMCGNGICCLAKFLQEIVYQTSYTIESISNHHRISIDNDYVTVSMCQNCDIKPPQKIIINDITYNVTIIDTGVPHGVIFVDDIKTVDLSTLGPQVRFHKLFHPHGINVNIANIQYNEVFVRTYERGVEKETLGCGTGATATAIAATKLKKILPPITVHTSSSILVIDFSISSGVISNISMKGLAKFIYKGQVNIKAI